MKKLMLNATLILTFFLSLSSFANEQCLSEGRDLVLLVQPDDLFYMDFKRQFSNSGQYLDEVFIEIKDGKAKKRKRYIPVGKTREGKQIQRYENLINTLRTYRERSTIENQTYQVNLCHDNEGHPIIRRIKSISNEKNPEVKKLEQKLTEKEAQIEGLNNILFAFAAGGNGCEEISNSSLHKQQEDYHVGEKAPLAVSQ